DIKKIFHRYVEPPQILGHELGGTVLAVGRGVNKWKPGDRVMSFHHVPCGKCFYCERRLFSQCKQYKTTGLTAGFTPNGGGFAERSEEHTSELQSLAYLVCRLLLEKKKLNRAALHGQRPLAEVRGHGLR